MLEEFKKKKERFIQWCGKHKYELIGTGLGVICGGIMLAKKEAHADTITEEEEMKNPEPDCSVKLFNCDDDAFMIQMGSDVTLDHDFIVTNMDDPNERIKFRPIAGTFKWEDSDEQEK